MEQAENGIGVLVEQALAVGRTGLRYHGDVRKVTPKRLTGQVAAMLSRGEAAIDRRAYTGRAGHGMYTPRATCQHLN